MIQNKLSRRQFLQIVAVGGIAGLTAKLGWDSLSQEAVISETRLLMGTVVNLKVVNADPAMARQSIGACLDRMEELESVFSHFQPESQLSQLNRYGFLEQADPSLVEVIQESISVSQLSGGAFDITIKPLIDLYQQVNRQRNGIPFEIQVQNALDKVSYEKIQISDRDIIFSRKGMGITVDGIAKGYIVDQGVSVLRQNGFQNVLVEAGGDLMALGTKSPNNPWKIGIQSPRKSTSSFLAAIPIQTQAVATSGDYHQAFSSDYQHHHIIDPRTGFSAPGLASATIVAPTVMQADVLATTAMVMNPTAGLSLIENLPGFEALFITKDLEILSTSGLG